MYAIIIHLNGVKAKMTTKQLDLGKTSDIDGRHTQGIVDALIWLCVFIMFTEETESECAPAGAFNAVHAYRPHSLTGRCNPNSICPVQRLNSFVTELHKHAHQLCLRDAVQSDVSCYKASNLKLHFDLMLHHK